MVDLLALSVDDDLPEADDVDKETNQRPGIAGSERRPDLGWRSGTIHGMGRSAEDHPLRSARGQRVGQPHHTERVEQSDESGEDWTE